MRKRMTNLEGCKSEIKQLLKKYYRKRNSEIPLSLKCRTYDQNCGLQKIRFNRTQYFKNIK